MSLSWNPVKDGWHGLNAQDFDTGTYTQFNSVDKRIPSGPPDMRDSEKLMSSLSVRTLREWVIDAFSLASVTGTDKLC